MVLDEPTDADVMYEDPEFVVIVDRTLIDRYSDLRLDYRINPWFEGISIRCANPRPGRC